jgi:hypothetical protein
VADRQAANAQPSTKPSATTAKQSGGVGD